MKEKTVWECEIGPLTLYVKRATGATFKPWCNGRGVNVEQPTLQAAINLCVNHAHLRIRMMRDDAIKALTSAQALLNEHWEGQ